MAYRIFISGKNYGREASNGSLPDEPVVSTKIKPVEEEKANSEIEKGELVLDPTTGALHKALGKPHSKGGTPVSLKDGSFIFSNYNKLAISKDEKEVFEFKLGGKYKEKNNTPAKVLEKEIDIEHHNKMIDILANEKKYPKEAINSAKLMMLKNLEKAGQVAFLQESKKGIQAPAFANETAPVYSKQTDEEINQSMQYLQKGGRKLTQEEIDQALLNRLTDTKGWNFRYKEGKRSYFDIPGSTTRTKPTAEQEAAYARYLANETPEQKMRRKARESQQKIASKYGYTEEMVTGDLPRTSLQRIDWHMAPKPYQPKAPSINLAPQGNAVGKSNGIIDPQTYDTKLTPWQKINIGIPFYRALNVKTQYPLKQHQESVIPQMENVNVQPQLDANNQGYFNAASLTKGMNPNQGSAYAQQLYGNRIAANNQAIGNVQQANVQTQKIMAATSLNQDAAQNRAFDLKYYDQTQTAIKNTRDLREAYTQQGVNNLNDTITKKLAFDSWLNSQQQYKGKPTYIDADGVQHYQGQALYTPKAGFWGNSVQYNPTEIDFSTYQSSQTSMEDDDALYVKSMRELLPGITDDGLKDLLEQRIKKKSLAAYSASNMQVQNIPPSFKKGGKYRSKKSC